MRRSRAPSRVALSPPGVGSVSVGTVGGTSAAAVKTPGVRRGTREGAHHKHGRADLDTSQHTKRENTAAVLKGSVSVVRAPVMGCLTVPRGVVVGSFKLPGGARRTDESKHLLRRKSLGVRRPITFMTSSKFRPPSPPEKLAEGEFVLQEGEGDSGGDGGDADKAPPPAEEDTHEPLVLWEAGPGEDDHRVSVDPRLCKWLRPHQREGVQFVFECVMGMREFDGSGCILADDMGLGKTLQSITVLWTLLKQGMEKGKPAVRRAIVVCPTSLVKNWEAEIDKWLKGDCRVIALSETTRDQVVQSINLFLASLIYRVLIVSYETFRLHAARFYAKADTCCDLLVCDEAHRLKNADTATTKALSALKCRKRVLLSGTPMQNDLEEFYAMTDFTNPGVLGSGSSFRKTFLAPILAGREPTATPKQVERAQKCQNEMSRVVNEFILRRTNNINAKHLPPKLVQVVCCRLTPLQTKIYKHLLSSKEIRHILNGKQTNILSSIGAMQKLCNHPKILVEGNAAGAGRGSGLAEEVASFLPTASGSSGGSSGGGMGFGYGRRGGGGIQKRVFPEWSGKMETLYRLMKEMRNTGDDRIVVVSNYTQSLDLIGAMCRENSWPFVRLDGSTGVSKRQKMVDAFNQPGPHSFAFLLSSKAGGCGLNLIGGNRLVLFDPDWNPAVDKQAAARVWRDGQKKRCFVYRFVSTGTIEEKVFQRQLSKEGLQNIVDDKEEVNSLSSKDLKDLFKLIEGTPSDTHDKLRCKRCRIEEAVQAVKDADARAFQRALPKQLTLCEELLSELRALPGGELFLEQWDPEAENATAEAFANAVHEPMDFGRIAAKLQASQARAEIASASSKPSGTVLSADKDVVDTEKGIVVEGDDREVAVGQQAESGSVSLSGSGTGAALYGSVPAFARDINLVFANVRRLWSPGSLGGDNRLTRAADSLKMAFDERWRDLAPRLHSIQREELEIARQEAKEKAKEAAEDREEGWVPPPRFQEQVGMPKEEDLNSWSHHYSTDTADDPVFRGAMMGTGDSLVSFVFGLEVTWGLMQMRLQEEAEEAARALEAKRKADEAMAARAEEEVALGEGEDAVATDEEDDAERQNEEDEECGRGKRGGRRRRLEASAEAATAAVASGGESPVGSGLVAGSAEHEGVLDAGQHLSETHESHSVGIAMDAGDEQWMSQEGGEGFHREGDGRQAKRIEEENPHSQEKEDDLCSGGGTQVEEPLLAEADGVGEGAGCGGPGAVESDDEEVMETPPLGGAAEENNGEDAASDAWVEVGGQRDCNPGGKDGSSGEDSAVLEWGSGTRDISRDSRALSCGESTVTVVGRNSDAGFEGPRSAKASWACSKCTFENEVSTRKCSVCGEGVRPAGIGRSQPLTPRALGEENREPPSGSQGSSKKKKQSKDKKKDKTPKKKDSKRKRDIWLDDDEDFE